LSIVRSNNLEQRADQTVLIIPKTMAHLRAMKKYELSVDQWRSNEGFLSGPAGHVGLTTKIHRLFDSEGLPPHIVLNGGPAPDASLTIPLLEGIETGPVIAAKVYENNKIVKVTRSPGHHRGGSAQCQSGQSLALRPTAGSVAESH